MMRKTITAESSAGKAKPPGSAPAPMPRLLVLQSPDKRMAALVAALAELGYSIGGVKPAEARALLEKSGPPEVLIAALDPASRRDAVAFARFCLGRWPGLRVVYLTWLVRTAPEPLLPGETVLPAPFTGECLARCLGEPARGQV